MNTPNVAIKGFPLLLLLGVVLGHTGFYWLWNTVVDPASSASMWGLGLGLLIIAMVSASIAALLGYVLGSVQANSSR
jgi:hypothetical protein